MTKSFLLKGRALAHKDTGPSQAHVYDTEKQIWIDTMNKMPLVSLVSKVKTASQFGETVQTNAREGVDQPSMEGMLASSFGETSITKTGGEGMDQTGEVLCMSQFGETSLTESGEGADCSEATTGLYDCY